MADAYHHAVSSSRKWGGEPEDYLALHQWFDASKRGFPGPQHRAMRHHSEGIGWLIDTFGQTITISTNPPKEIPVRWIGEMHIVEDFGRIPVMADFLREMAAPPWMTRGARKLSRELSEVQGTPPSLASPSHT